MPATVLLTLGGTAIVYLTASEAVWEDLLLLAEQSPVERETHQIGNEVIDHTEEDRREKSCLERNTE